MIQHMNTVVIAIDKAREILGSFAAIGEVCGGPSGKPLTGKAVEKWRKRGRLPRTEYTGETQYSELIEAATGGRVLRSELCPDLRTLNAANAAESP